MFSAMPELNPRRRLPERHENLEDCCADSEERRSVLQGKFSELSELPGITEERFFTTPPSKPQPMKAPFQRPYVDGNSFQGRKSYKPRYVAEGLPAVLMASTPQTERPATCAVVAAGGAVRNGRSPATRMLRYRAGCDHAQCGHQRVRKGPAVSIGLPPLLRAMQCHNLVSEAITHGAAISACEKGQRC